MEASHVNMAATFTGLLLRNLNLVTIPCIYRYILNGMVSFSWQVEGLAAVAADHGRMVEYAVAQLHPHLIA